jgi:hypothetical protein
MNGAVQPPWCTSACSLLLLSPLSPGFSPGYIITRNFYHINPILEGGEGEGRGGKKEEKRGGEWTYTECPVSH